MTSDKLVDVTTTQVTAAVFVFRVYPMRRHLVATTSPENLIKFSFVLNYSLMMNHQAKQLKARLNEL